MKKLLWIRIVSVVILAAFGFSDMAIGMSLEKSSLRVPMNSKGRSEETPPHWMGMASAYTVEKLLGIYNTLSKLEGIKKNPVISQYWPRIVASLASLDPAVVKAAEEVLLECPLDTQSAIRKGGR